MPPLPPAGRSGAKPPIARSVNPLTGPDSSLSSPFVLGARSPAWVALGGAFVCAERQTTGRVVPSDPLEWRLLRFRDKRSGPPFISL
jgi:hypothetical protein